jgi:hypothetical protein
MMNITQLVKVMLDAFTEKVKRRQASGKISAQDDTGAHPIVNSAKAEKHCPITVPRRYQDDEKMKDILEKNEKKTEAYVEDKSALIREASVRMIELTEDELRIQLVQAIQELAIDLANTTRVRNQLVENKFPPSNITDVQLGNAAALEYILDNMGDDAAKLYLFDSAKKLAERYSALHNVALPKDSQTVISPFLTQESVATVDTDATMEEKDPIKSDDACQKIITMTKNMLTDLFPLMTTPFWNEFIEAEINRTIDKDTKIRSKAASQEKANREVNLQLENLKNLEQTDPQAYIKLMAQAVRKEFDADEKKKKRKQKKDSRKKSSAVPQKNQGTNATNNGRSRNGKSKKKAQKDGQQQQNHANSSSNNNNNNSNSNNNNSNSNSNNTGGRGTSGGRRRNDDNGRSRRGGRGKGRGRGNKAQN